MPSNNIRAPRANLSIQEAAAQCRSSHHGSYNYQEAYQVLIDQYRSAHPTYLNPTLEELWGWVDSQS